MHRKSSLGSDAFDFLRDRDVGAPRGLSFTATVRPDFEAMIDVTGTQKMDCLF